MQVQDVPRWAWALIGVVVGLLIAYVWTGSEPGVVRDVSAQQFRNYAARTSNHEAARGEPILTDIVVYPPVEGAYGRAVYPVTFKELRFQGDTPVRVSRGVNAEVPFIERSENANNTVIDFLKSIEERNPQMRWRYAIERESRYAYAIGAGAGLVLIGGVWPSLVRLLVGAGLGRAASEEKAEKATRRSSKPSKAVAPDLAPKGPSAADERALRDYTSELESKVGPAGAGEAGAGEAGAGEVGAGPAHGGSGHVEPRDAVVKPLGGTNASGGESTQTPHVEVAKEDVKFEGEWYPVARPAHHDPKPPGKA